MAGYGRPVSQAERAAAAEARQATLDKLHTQLSEGTLALNDPQAWQAWLKFSSQFHRYSTGSTGILERREWWLSGAGGGCVVGPVSAGFGGVSGEVGGAQAEDAGEHGGWDFAAELFGGGEPHAAGFDADASQAGAEVGGVGVGSSVPAGEEPGVGELLGGAAASVLSPGRGGARGPRPGPCRWRG